MTTPFKTICLILTVTAILGCRSSDPNNGSPVYYTPEPAETPRSFTTAAKDTLVLTRVKAKFVSDDLVSDDGIDIRVRHGVVFLEGDAQDAHHRRMAGDLASTVDGVVRVENRLGLVHTGTTFAPPEPLVSDKIKMALIQDPEMSGLPVVVQTTATHVLLSGKVRSQAQKQKVEAIAAEHAQDRQIINKISVVN